jgi:metal-responsive CopG/Arc/MetJ family transcriptional regulator
MMKLMESAVLKDEIVNARLTRGTGERIDRVLYGGEVRSAFIRRAVETELQRREAELKDKQR